MRHAVNIQFAPDHDWPDVLWDNIISKFKGSGMDPVISDEYPYLYVSFYNPGYCVSIRYRNAAIVGPHIFLSSVPGSLLFYARTLTPA